MRKELLFFEKVSGGVHELFPVVEFQGLDHGLAAFEVLLHGAVLQDFVDYDLVCLLRDHFPGLSAPEVTFVHPSLLFLAH